MIDIKGKNEILDIKDNVSANSSVKYKGSVKILYIDKNSGKSRVVYQDNNGNFGLYTAICRLLIGLNSTDYIPSAIMGYNIQEKEMFSRKIGYASTPLLYLNDNIATEEKANIVKYTFMVPAINLNMNIDNNITQLKLFNQKGMECATLDLSGNPISIDFNSNLLIYWKLKFE